MKTNPYSLQVRHLFVVASMVFGLSVLDAQAIGYPNLQDITEPTSDYLSFPSFNPPIDSSLTISSQAPEIAEWTRQNQPSDTMALTGERLSAFSGDAEGRDTRFVIYGEGGAVDGLIQRLDGRQCAVTLPSSLPANEMYLMWPRNENGFGEPISINRTEAWWMGPNKASAGDVFSIYGRNLSLGGAVTKLYCTERNEWLTSISQNPYKADFTIPANWPNGIYTLWAHNGKGQKYGWAESLSLEVIAATDWTAGTTVDVTAYGATPNDGTDDLAAINSAIAALGAGDTLYFPAGTFNISSRMRPGSGHRIMGAGMDLTTITTSSGFTSAGAYYGVMDQNLSNGEVRDITISAGQYQNSHQRTIVMDGSSNFLFENVRITQKDISTTAVSDNLRAENCSNGRFVHCEIIGYRPMSLGNAAGVSIEGCDFRGVFDQNVMLYINGVNGVALFNSTATSYDDSVDTDGSGWSAGRWVSGSRPRNVYIGDNSTTNMVPRWDPNYGDYDQPVNQGGGEQIMFEGLYTRTRELVTSSTASSTTLASIYSVSAGDIATIVSGRGIGQSRVVSSVAGSMIGVAEPWRVVPDLTSVIAIGSFGRRLAVYNNMFDGVARSSEPPPGTGRDPYRNATAAVNLYGGFSDAVIEGNTGKELATAFMQWSLAESATRVEDSSPNLWEPDYFNLWVGNTADVVRTGFSLVTGSFKSNPRIHDDTTQLGSVWRGNVISNVTVAAWTISCEEFPHIGIQVFDGNTSHATFGISTDTRLANMTFVGNDFGSEAVAFTHNSTYALRDNTFAYASQLPGGILEAPARVIQLGSGVSSGSFTLWNSGTAPLSWTATESSSWLTLTKASGTISGESSSDRVTFSVTNPSGAATITVTAGGQTKQLTVTYEKTILTPTSTTYQYPLSGQSGKPLRAEVFDRVTEQVRMIGGLENRSELFVDNVISGHEYRIRLQEFNGTSWIQTGSDISFRHE